MPALRRFSPLQNNLLFLMADEDQLEQMIKQPSRYLAIRQITGDSDRMSEFSDEQRKTEKHV